MKANLSRNLYPAIPTIKSTSKMNFMMHINFLFSEL